MTWPPLCGTLSGISWAPGFEPPLELRRAFVGGGWIANAPYITCKTVEVYEVKIICLFRGLVAFGGGLVVFSGGLVAFSGGLVPTSGGLVLFSGEFVIISGLLVVFGGRPFCLKRLP
jgi:hypothetical protein